MDTAVASDCTDWPHNRLELDCMSYRIAIVDLFDYANRMWSVDR